MKKIIALCLTLAMSASALCACSESEESKESTSSDSSANSSQAESSDSESSAESNTTETYCYSEDSFVDVYGINLYLADSINYTSADNGISTWQWEREGYHIYIANFGDDTIYASFENDIGYSEDADSYDLEDAPEIAAENIEKAISQVFDNYEDKREITVDSETTETIGDKTFINQKGNIHLEYIEPEDTHELSYTAYYTLNESTYNEKTPVSLILFSDKCETATEEEMDRLAKEILSNTVWIAE